MDRLKDLHQELQKDIKFASERSAVYHNKKRDRGPTLKKGDKVYLLRRNIKTKRPSSKLDHMKLGPFKVAKVRGSVNCELELPTAMRIHPVFHISLLEPADPETPLQDNPPEIDPESQDVEFEVEEILDRQRIDGQPHYLVRWKGYEPSGNTWEPEENLTHCVAKLRQFRQRNPQQTSRRTKSQNPPDQELNLQKGLGEAL